jgi:asparagine synthase (glutamine-hydrolysing)
LGAAFRGVGRRRAWNEDRAFLKKDALLPRSDVHPWLCAPRFALPGKSDHVRSLVQIQHFLDRRLSGGTAALHPLMAQPLLETCLAIPTWLWVRGGVDRAIARQAFKDMLPAEILRRKNKGSLEGLFHRSFVRLRCELRDILLGGELRGLEILDAAAVEMAFAAGESIPVEDQMRISEMVALDLWLQSWRAREPAALKG